MRMSNVAVKEKKKKGLRMYKWCILTELALRRQPFLLNLLIQALLSLKQFVQGFKVVGYFLIKHQSS